MKSLQMHSFAIEMECAPGKEEIFAGTELITQMKYALL